MVSNPTLPTENINQVILGLLSLEPNEIDDLDYETYKSYLKELLVEVTASKRKIGDDEFNLVKNEFKRVRGKKGRFKIKKTKISADKLGLGGITKQIKGTQKRLMLAPVGGVPKTQEKIETISQKTKESPLLKISETLDSILSTLIDIGKQDAKEREKNRRSEEEKRRIGRETELESKTFEGIKKAISTITKPLQSIWDKIVNFITNIILGRIVLKLIDWIADPKNQGKIQSIIRFVKDWWPALLGSYILFGTKFGGLIRFIGGWAVKLAFQLGKVVIPKLLTLIAKNPIAALAVAGGIGAYAATQQNKERRDEAAKTDPSIVKPEETAKTGKGPGPAQLSEEQIGQQGLGLAFSGGGEVRWPGFSGGGFNFRGMMGGASMGAMFGPLGMLLGGALGSGKPQEMFSGLVSGPGGPKDDKVPAMLSDGEFVMSAGAVQKYGVDTLESMNAAGGGTNIPKVVGGTTYAAGGGYIGRDPVSELKKHFNNFIKSRGAGSNFDIGNPKTWGGNGAGTSVSGGGGTGAFLNGMGYVGRAAAQVPKMASNIAGPRLSYLQRVAGEGQKMAVPVATRAQRIPGEIKKKVNSTIEGISGLVGSTMSGLKPVVTSGSAASQEAIPAVLNSVLGRSVTDTSISEDMQKQILQAQKTARKKGRDFIEYEDYEGGGRFSGAGLTMGRIGDKEFKRDDKGRIIGLRQVYDTDATVEKAMGAFKGDMSQFGSSLMKGKPDFKALMGGYKLIEALLAGSQNRGKTLHDVNFDEKVLGFKPGKEVLNDRQKQIIGEQKNREELQNKRPWWDKMGIFGGASAEMKRQGQKQAESFAKTGGYGRYSPGPSQRKIESVKPLPRATPPQVISGGSGRRRGSGVNYPRQGTKPPIQSPTHRKGTMTSASAYGIMR
jgi:hypothetical protein